MPYEYRRMTREQREATLKERADKGYPLHAPPHPIKEKSYYLLTAANFEHRHIMARAQRRTEFQTKAFEKFSEFELQTAGWVFLPNHYHVMAYVPVFAKLPLLFNRLHGATARQWNLEDRQTGRRKVWYEFSDRMIRGEAHFYATLNYLHYNPVKHGYVKRMNEWEWSSFNWYLEEKGQDWLIEIWKKYPIKNYGEKWDLF